MKNPVIIASVSLSAVLAMASVQKSSFPQEHKQTREEAPTLTEEILLTAIKTEAGERTSSKPSFRQRNRA